MLQLLSISDQDKSKCKRSKSKCNEVRVTIFNLIENMENASHIFLAVMTAHKFPPPCHSHESVSVLVTVHSWDCPPDPLRRTCCQLILVALSFRLSSSMAIIGSVVVQEFSVSGHCYGDGEGVNVIVVGGSGCGRSGISVTDGIIISGVDVCCVRIRF